MTRKKRKSPQRHTGRILPVRTAGQIRLEATEGTKGRRATITLDDWRNAIDDIKERELSFVHDEPSRQVYMDRTAVLAECMAAIDLFEKQIADGSQNTEAMLCHAIMIGKLIEQARLRVLEAPAVDGIEQSLRGKQQASENRVGSFSISREDLLKRCRAAYREGSCNQKELRRRVAAKLPIGPDRVKQLMAEYRIHKADYS